MAKYLVLERCYINLALHDPAKSVHPETKEQIPIILELDEAEGSKYENRPGQMGVLERIPDSEKVVESPRAAKARRLVESAKQASPLDAID